MKKFLKFFIISQENPLCELKVKVINIGGKEVLKLPIIKNCDILKEYCEFIAAVFRKKALLKPDCTNEEARTALEQAMKECIKKDILTEYLIRKGTEVINMFFGEYSYEEDIAAQREEAKKEGLQQGLQQKAIETAIAFLNEKTPPETVARCVNLPLEKVLELQENIKAEG